MMRVLVILVFGVHLTSAAIHSLQYFYTATTGISNFPRFVDVGILNGEVISMYDSTTQRKVPKQSWMAENLDQQYWDRGTDNVKGTEAAFYNHIQVAMSRFNQTAGVHTFQLMYGCEQEDDGTTQGYYQYAYDGNDFLSLDKKTLSWTPANPQAVITKHKWEATGVMANYWKGYLENTCIEWVNKYVGYGKATLERKVAPEVSLLQKNSLSPVICHATGFHPSNIMMTWKKSNEDHNEDVEVSATLPNQDGTFQKSISLSVKSEEWKKNPDVYRCVIQHVGAEKEIVVTLNENNIKSNTASFNIIAMVVGCVVALAVLAAIIGFVVWKKSKGYKKANTLDSDSENSDQPLPKA